MGWSTSYPILSQHNINIINGCRLFNSSLVLSCVYKRSSYLMPPLKQAGPSRPSIAFWRIVPKNEEIYLGSVNFSLPIGSLLLLLPEDIFVSIICEMFWLKVINF